MILEVSPSKLQGDVAIPPSKSHTIRALLFAAFGDGASTIVAPLVSDDTASTVRCIEALGVTLKTLTINDAPAYQLIPPLGGLYRALQNTSKMTRLDVGNSGSTLYFLAMLLSTVCAPFTLTGDCSIATRPLDPLLEIYVQGGVRFSVGNPAHAYVPLEINGGLHSGSFSSEGSFSQVISGLLMCAPFLAGETRIRLSKPKEFSYVKMTITWLTSLGFPVDISQCSTETVLSLHPPITCYAFPAFRRRIPADWSSAIFPLLAALATRSVLTLRNLDLTDSQGDVVIIEVLQSIGVAFDIDKGIKLLTIYPPAQLKVLDFDCGNNPDAVPALAAIATLAQGRSRLYNAGICRFKECDRLAVISAELSKLGACVQEETDALIIEGRGIESLHSAELDSHGDHRIALTLASLTLGINACTSKKSRIHNAECCSVSYPDFITTMQECGAQFKPTWGAPEMKSSI